MLHIDFETRSEAELGGPSSVGVWNYAHDPSTEPLMLAWAYDNEPVELWEPRLGSMPERLLKGLQNPNQEVAAFNSTFERYVLKFKLGIDVPIHRFQDPQASARYLSLPGSLEDVSSILGLPQDKAKDKLGKKLIDLFCKPHKKRKKKGEAEEWAFNDWNSHPLEWEQFKEYCRQDVVAEREVMRREKLLGVWPLPPNERKIWILDQVINDRGIPVDRKFVTNAYELANREKQETIKLNNEKTGLENSNSNTQLLAWARQQGYDGTDPDVPEGHKDYPKYSLEKDVVKSQLKNNPNLTSLCREVLENRQASASTTYKKMAAILRQINSDDRVRNQFVYLGSSRCGRWAGTGIQFHNLARPTEIFEETETVDKARAMIYNMDYEGIKKTFGSALLTVKSNIRTAFVAPKGYRFNVADLNAIETRVGAWLADCKPLLNGFLTIKDFDPYMDFAMKMTQIPYEVLVRDKKSDNPTLKAAAKRHRQIAKPGVLGCIYRMSAKALQAYAEAMGVILTLEQCEQIVKVFREAYKEIAQAWSDLEEKIGDVLQGTKTVRYFGPNDCIKIDKFVFNCNGVPRTILRIELPSGRRLHYLDAQWIPTKMPWKNRDTGEDVYRESFNYASQDQKTKQWSTVSSHGGKVFENIDQGMSRDVIAQKLLQFEEIMPVVLHVHDEGGAEVEDDPFSPGLAEMNEIIAQPVSWAPGLSLGSDGFESTYYHK